MTVSLCQRAKVGTDPMNNPVYADTWVDVDNVIVSPASSQEITDTIDLYGKRATYSLCIPKNDTHDWNNSVVRFFGAEWRTIGPALEYMEHLVPLDWNKKVVVESARP